ncbi:MAG: peptide deformylase [Candidatus Wallbacteria bacterium]|nr:peptide deformylase [Candidatus Wallbacteria bacterium]
MILELRILGDPVLRQVARDVEAVTPNVRALLDDMVETMHAVGGVGLAAPQVGISLRLIVLGWNKKQWRMINPEISAATGEQASFEACLSIPGAEGEVRRAAKVTVRYVDERGRQRRLTSTGLLSRVLQHEIDHLYGVLFVDRLGAERVMTAPSDLRSLRESPHEERAAS